MLDDLLVVLLIIILWAGDTFFIKMWIRLSAKKKWNKCKREYPYFSANFIQKIFLYGLRGTLDVATIVLTYIFHISSFVGFITGIFAIIFPEEIIVEYLFRVSIGVFIFSHCFKLFFLYKTPPKF